MTQPTIWIFGTSHSAGACEFADPTHKHAQVHPALGGFPRFMHEHATYGYRVAQALDAQVLNFSVSGSSNNTIEAVLSAAVRDPQLADPILILFEPRTWYDFQEFPLHQLKSEFWQMYNKKLDHNNRMITKLMEAGKLKEDLSMWNNRWYAGTAGHDHAMIRNDIWLKVSRYCFAQYFPQLNWTDIKNTSIYQNLKGANTSDGKGSVPDNIYKLLPDTEKHSNEYDQWLRECLSTDFLLYYFDHHIKNSNSTEQGARNLARELRNMNAIAQTRNSKVGWFFWDRPMIWNKFKDIELATLPNSVFGPEYRHSSMMWLSKEHVAKYQEADDCCTCGHWGPIAHEYLANQIVEWYNEQT